MKTYIIKKEQSPIPVIPGEWNYEESIKRLQPLVYKWKNLTIEVAQELYVAREKLSSRYHRDETNVPSWDRYCQDIGIEKRTANRWLSQFFPAEQKVTALAKTDEMCAIEDLESLIDSGKRYSTILADPPWAYSNQATRAATDNHYETMPLDDICALPITDIVSDNAHLHLWTTNAFLFDAKRVMESWGFEYKSVFIWIKPSMGIGNYWRVSSGNRAVTLMFSTPLILIFHPCAIIKNKIFCLNGIPGGFAYPSISRDCDGGVNGPIPYPSPGSRR